jgi:hypothetical protein
MVFSNRTQNEIAVMFDTKQPNISNILSKCSYVTYKDSIEIICNILGEVNYGV